MDAAPDILRLHRPPLVLLADSDADTRALNSLVLYLHNLQVAYAADGPSALELARKTFPDVLVTDTALEDGDGFELATMLRNDPATAAVRIVAVTASTGHRLLQRSEEAGFDELLLKPVAPDALVGAVHRALAAGPTFREQARHIRVQSEQLRAAVTANRRETRSAIEQSRSLLAEIRAFLRRRK